MHDPLLPPPFQKAEMGEDRNSMISRNYNFHSNIILSPPPSVVACPALPDVRCRAFFAGSDGGGTGGGKGSHPPFLYFCSSHNFASYGYYLRLPKHRL